MPKESMQQCRCGDAEPVIDRDESCEATIIECLSCGRMVGAANEADALVMWVMAMRESVKTDC